MKVRVCDSVEISFSDEGAFLVNKELSERFSVSGAGIDFLQLIDGERTLDDIIEKLLEIYGGVEPYTLVKDMEQFVQDLAVSGLVEVFRDEE